VFELEAFSLLVFCSMSWVPCWSDRVFVALPGQVVALEARSGCVRTIEAAVDNAQIRGRQWRD
jgi:hypothetical protein